MIPFLLHLSAAVLLLLWAVRMVRTGVERAFGGQLRAILRGAAGGRIGIAVAGAGLAIVLQSATAVGVLATGFATSGILGIGAGIAALLGADAGSSLVVKILSFDLSDLIPILILVGATMFLKFEARSLKQGGRIILGIAFILLSLGMMTAATEPLRHAQLLPTVAAWLSHDPVSAFLITTLLAWAMHSSVATLLLIASFAGSGLLPVEASLAFVLGANVGGAIIAVWLTRGSDPVARRIPMGNLICRAVGAALVLAVSQVVALPIDMLGTTPGATIVNLHVLFNVVLVAVSLPCIPWVERLTELLLPTPPVPEGPATRVSALDRSVLHLPGLALASVKRELLDMGQTVAEMLGPTLEMIEHPSEAEIARLRELDASVNVRHTEIKLFIAEMNRGELTDKEAQQGLQLTDFAINLERAGDLIAKTLLPIAVQRARRGISFSPDGWSEIKALHARVMTNLQLSLNVLLSADVSSARELAKEKEIIRKMERDSHTRHLERLRSDTTASIETSDMHLEILRALKEINSLLVTVAYPILTESGQLLQSRLAKPEKDAVETTA